nr:MAG TPA: Cytosine specific methyltransferase [Caudoviricetes sp.]
MTFIDFFAGVGGFRRGLELAGHHCVGFCEKDKHAVASYIAMHHTTDAELENLSHLSMQKRAKEIYDRRYDLHEWYAEDITGVQPYDVPDADIWCFGAPCQDFSFAGRRRGLEGDKSILVQEIFRLLQGRRKEDRPRYIIYENVKGVLSSYGGRDFGRILREMDNCGYDAEWQVLDSAAYVPQHRERVYVIGHLRDGRFSQVFPIPGADRKNCIKQIGRLAGERNRNQYRVYDAAGACPTLNGMQGGGRVPIIAFCDLTYGAGICMTDISRTLIATYNRKTADHRSGKTGIVIADGKEIQMRQLTPKECFRLQGWQDEYFERAAYVCSDTQLYRQAGNGVTVPVVEEIGRRLHDDRV